MASESVIFGSVFGGIFTKTIVSYAEDNTWVRVDVEFLFLCWTWYIKLNGRREIPYLQAAMYYSVYYTH